MSESAYEVVLSQIKLDSHDRNGSGGLRCEISNRELWQPVKTFISVSDISLRKSDQGEVTVQTHANVTPWQNFIFVQCSFCFKLFGRSPLRLCCLSHVVNYWAHRHELCIRFYSSLDCLKKIFLLFWDLLFFQYTMGIRPSLYSHCVGSVGSDVDTLIKSMPNFRPALCSQLDSTSPPQCCPWQHIWCKLNQIFQHIKM